MIEFKDSNCMIGNAAAPREGSVKDIRGHYELMDRCGVTGCLAYHSDAAEGYISEGNKKITELSDSEKRIVGQWVVIPDFTGEFMRASEIPAEMKKHNIRSVRIFPRKHGFSTKEYVCGDIFSVFAEHRIPIFVSSDEIGWDDLYDIMHRHGNLSIVLVGAEYGCERYMYPLMDKCRNLFLETSKYLTNNGIAEIAENFGAERLIFGSGMPGCSLCGAVTLIRYADISEEEKKMIAAENIKRLMGGVIFD